MELSTEQLSSLRDLVRTGVLDEDQERAVVAALHRPAAATRPERLIEVIGYVGGGLLLGGAALLVSTSWDDLSRGSRIGLLTAATLVLLVGGLLIAGGPTAVRVISGVRRRIVGTLFALASGTTAFLGGATVDRDELFVGSLAGLVVAAATYLLLPTAPGLLATGLFSALVVGDAAGEQADGTSLTVGLALFVLGTAWIGITLSGLVPQRQLGLAVGATIALIGAQLPITDNDTAAWAYGLTAIAAVGSFATYLREHSLVLLVAGVVATTLVVPEAVWDWTDGTVSGGGLVLVAGVVLLAASGLGMRLRKAEN
ncbi:DUF2157 domain-containing protein [Lentzea tibetensis]|uniref:DUF2157 domain-containing protein n=1 Tax=Lentzea tibetensis TaxID=2591470 RepID=UPI0016469170|nr:DUF2157 domain-containing protein [Lentzea tibetensis]